MTYCEIIKEVETVEPATIHESSVVPFFQLFLTFSILGTVYYGYFFAFHLLHITNNNQLLKRVMMAITRNGKNI